MILWAANFTPPPNSCSLDILRESCETPWAISTAYREWKINVHLFSQELVHNKALFGIQCLKSLEFVWGERCLAWRGQARWVWGGGQYFWIYGSNVQITWPCLLGKFNSPGLLVYGSPAQMNVCWCLSLVVDKQNSFPDHFPNAQTCMSSCRLESGSTETKLREIDRKRFQRTILAWQK